jgi:endonuclease III
MAMTVHEFITVWPVLKKQIRTLHVPWLDNMASSDRDPFRVLISCILSLRTKDEVTAAASVRLFRLAATPEGLSRLPVPAIERTIYPAGFYKVKARRIKKMSADILKRFDGRVPDTIDDLLTLEGVGRKTANLVVTLGYNKPGICVDTHVHRLTNRWGLIRTRTPYETEFALREMLPRRYWKRLNGVLVAFGQGICRPVSPLCSRCGIRSACGRIGVTKSR